MMSTVDPVVHASVAAERTVVASLHACCNTLSQQAGIGLAAHKGFSDVVGPRM